MSAQRLRAFYGARLLHLVGLVAVLGVSAYAIVQVAGRPDFRAMAVWFLGAVILHDLVFLPAYSAINGLIASAGPVRRRRTGALVVLNHLRARSPSPPSCSSSSTPRSSRRPRVGSSATPATGPIRF